MGLLQVAGVCDSAYRVVGFLWHRGLLSVSPVVIVTVASSVVLTVD